MQHSAKSFIIHLANANQIEAFMAQGLTFRGHLLEMSKAKNTTTVILDRVPYGLPEASIKLALSRYSEVKSLRAVNHKGYGLSKFKVEMVLNQDIPSRIAVQGNHLNIFYKNQPRSCFVCTGAGHEVKNCPKKAANKRPAPPDNTHNKAPQTYAESTAHKVTDRPPAGDSAVVITGPTTTDGVPQAIPAEHTPTTRLAAAAQDQPSGDSTDRPGTTPFVGTDLTKNASSTEVSDAAPQEMEVTEQRSGADTPSSESSSTSGPPASAMPVPPRGIDSTTEKPSATEPHHTPVLPTAEPPTQVLATYPNLDQYFEETPPTRLQSRPEIQDSSSASSGSRPRSKRSSGGIGKKTKVTHMSTETLAAGMRNRTHPQVVCGRRKKTELTQNRFELLSESLNDESD